MLTVAPILQLLCVIEGVHGGAPDLNSSVQQDSDEDCVLIDSCDVSKEVVVHLYISSWIYSIFYSLNPLALITKLTLKYNQTINIVFFIQVETIDIDDSDDDSIVDVEADMPRLTKVDIVTQTVTVCKHRAVQPNWKLKGPFRQKAGRRRTRGRLY